MSTNLKILNEPREIPLDPWSCLVFLQCCLGVDIVAIIKFTVDNKEISGRRDGRYEQITSVSNYNRNPFPFGNGIFYV